MSSRAGGSAALRPVFKARWHLINKGLWIKVTGTPLKVYRVKGDWIRGDTWEGEYKSIYGDFTEGGNSEAYVWMPPDLIIIEDDMSAFNQKSTLIHEMEELITMARDHLDYETAHSKHANPKEQEFRKHPEQFGKLWRGLVEEYKDFLAKVNGKADRVGTKP